ncbi:hypothetical protein ACWCQX_38580, partial [Streptomyces sp. NPDC002346]
RAVRRAPPASAAELGTHSGPEAAHPAVRPGDLWVPERECGIAAPAGLVRGLLDGWVADSPDSREWRDLEEVC